MGVYSVDPINAAIGAGYMAYSAYKRFRPDMDEEQAEVYAAGLREKRVKSIKAGRKRYNPMKILKAGLSSWTQNLCVKSLTTNLINYKHLVSEYNPGNPGFIVVKNEPVQGNARGWLPLHVYDLNWLYSGNRPQESGTGTAPFVDNATNFSTISTNQNADINARAWCLGADGTFKTLKNDTGTVPTLSFTEDVRWTVSKHNPGWNEVIAPTNVSDRISDRKSIYRNWADIKYCFYGTTQAPIEYEISVIKILDPHMCPDYEDNLTDRADLTTIANPVVSGETVLTDFKQYWQNLVMGWCNNPMLRGVESKPKAPKPWFRYVARKKIKVGEQLSNNDTIPCVRGSIHVAMNEMNNLFWGMSGRTIDAHNTNAEFDDVPDADDAIDDVIFNEVKVKPYYTSRYYLMIRATDYGPTGGADPLVTSIGGVFNPNRVATQTGGSYDLVVRTKFSELEKSF